MMTKKNDTRRKVFIIAEAGSNWRVGNPDRDMAMARALIDAAASAQADAVKFQTYRAKTVYVKNAGNSDYLRETGIKKDIVEIFDDLSMPYEMIPALAEYCAEVGIAFMSTPFSLADAKEIDPFVQVHKIASYEISHIRLIDFFAKAGKPLIMSTGAASEDDVQWAVERFFNAGGNDLTLLQCTAKYPAPLSSLNLRCIPSLAERFAVQVGMSDHSRDPFIGPLGAVALGASVVEKHFTLHNALPGPDHSFAITSDELTQMVLAIRKMEQSLGSGTIKVLDDEQELRGFAQRSVQAIQAIKEGELFVEGGNIDVLRSGVQKKGVHPRFLDEVVGKKARRSIGAGDGINHDDW